MTAVRMGVKGRTCGNAYLEPAHERVGYVVLEQMTALVVYTRPSPHVFIAALRFTLIEDGGTDGPHDDAEDEESNGEDGVVSGDFLCSIVPTS